MLGRIAALAGSVALLLSGPARAQVTPLDLQPDDWAYRTLSSLRLRHGCATPVTEAIFNSGGNLSRYSAAVLLKACLARMRRSEPEATLLMQQLGSELAALGAAVEELEANRFSTTTRLRGVSTMVFGANRFAGTDTQKVSESRKRFGATTFNYDLKLILDTSFSGSDLLRARLRSGNFDRVSNSFYGAGPSGLSALEPAFQEKTGPNIMAINRLYYLFPLGKGFRAGVGARVGQLDLLALDPGIYPAETVLDWFTLNGAPAAYNFNLGAGAGLWWQSPGGFSVSANYVAAHAAQGSPEQGGLGTRAAASSASVQLGYQGEQWAAAAIVSSLQNSGGVLDYATSFTLDSLRNPGNTLAFALSGYWQPAQSGWLPAISGGWGFNSTSYDAGIKRQGLVASSQSWSVGLQWNDAFTTGNTLGMAVGQPTFATALYGGEQPRDGNYAWEWWYRVQLSDNVAITPAVFLLSRPLGADTPAGQSFSQIGALLKSTIRF